MPTVGVNTTTDSNVAAEPALRTAEVPVVATTEAVSDIDAIVAPAPETVIKRGFVPCSTAFNVTWLPSPATALIAVFEAVPVEIPSAV